ncbi:MAG: DNA-3-methyladenine glycosylase II [Paracoccaceae bacterium]|jgi:DNA-3-methyladenine glycosylase II
MNSRLTLETFNKALTILAQQDPDLGAVISKFGKPPVWRRPRGLETLILLILEQQVSLASARAAYDRLAATAVDLAPKKLLTLRDEEFRAAGVSRQKTRYIRHLSECVLDRSLRIDRLGRMSDDDVRAHLMQVKGIGAWTADVYLLMVLMRPDVWPVGDIALQAAAHGIKGLKARPDPEELTGIGEEWRPWRSVAARILWHYYLSTPRIRTTGRK